MLVVTAFPAQAGTNSFPEKKKLALGGGELSSHLQLPTATQSLIMGVKSQILALPPACRSGRT